MQTRHHDRTTHQEQIDTAFHDRRTGEGRRQELVLAAYQIIAEQGFEGLRTRDVAGQAGVNIATLHYYFPSKEDLIRGVREYLSDLFMTRHAPGYTGTGNPRARLHEELSEVEYYARAHPEMLTVHLEFVLRSQRDPTIRPLLEELDQHWFASLIGILEAGVADGTFRADLDTDAGVKTIMAFVRGSALTTFATPDEFARTCREIERWLIGNEGGSLQNTHHPITASDRSVSQSRKD